MTQEPTNDGEKKVIRNEKGQIMPGSVLNPIGKAPGTKHLTTKLWEALQRVALDKNGEPNKDQKTYADQLVERILIDSIGKGNTRLIDMIYDRIDGKPDQALNINHSGEGLQAGADVMEIARQVAQQLKNKKTE